MNNKMGKLNPRRVLCWAIISMAGLLHGCGVLTVPGFDFADPSTRTSVTLGQYVPGDVDQPPQGVVIPITPQLVQAQAAARPRTVPDGVAHLFGEPKPYTIGPGDIVAVVVYDHPELLPLGGQVIGGNTDPTGITGAPGFIVDSKGEIFYPYAKRVKIAGLTESEASEVITSRISRVIKDPQVTVRVASFRSRRAYVEGEVRVPGTQIFTDLPMTLTDAINRAGGFTANGDRSYVTVTRKNATVAVDMIRMQELNINPNRILLEDGDSVIVHHREERKVFVMGEAAHPSALLMRNGRLTLNEALGEAGGPSLVTANTSQIYVIRNVPGQDLPAVYHLNAGNPVALALAETFPLQPRDVVYIDPVPLVAWNRILSLIIPSANAVYTGQRILNQ